MATLTREYLEDQIAKCRSAIAFRSPKADMTFAKAKLDAAEAKLAALNASVAA